MDMLHPLYASLTVTIVLALVVLAAVYSMTYLLALENAPESSQGFASQAGAARPEQYRYTSSAADELTDDELINAVKFAYHSLSYFP